MNELGSVLFGRTRGALLGWLFGHPDDRYYLRQLVRHAGVSVGSAQKELKTLERAGLVHRRAEGNQVYFQANTRSPVFAELQQLLLKTVGAVGVLQGALLPVASAIDACWIFGSTSRGELRSSSDLDVFVLGDVSFVDVVERLGPAQETLGREINPVVYTRDEFRRKADSHFVSSVLQQPKTFVIGDESELGRLAEVRVPPETRGNRNRDRKSARNRGARSRR